MTKICTKCKNELQATTEFFYKSGKSLQTKCKKCANIMQARWKMENKEKVKLSARKYREKNKEKIIESHKCWMKSNKTRNREQKSKWRLENKEYHVKYNRERMKTDEKFKILNTLRRRLSSALDGKTKSQSTLELLGCDIDSLLIHLQLSAIANGHLDFNIDNYSGKEYHVDHIKPCAKFDLSKPEEQRKCFNYSNLQILSAHENIIKSDN